MAEAYIVDAVRTAGGKRGGKLAGWHPVDMAASVLDAIVARTGIDGAAVEDVIMGCVMQGGQQAGQVGRNAVLAARNLPGLLPALHHATHNDVFNCCAIDTGPCNNRVEHGG